MHPEVWRLAVLFPVFITIITPGVMKACRRSLPFSLTPADRHMFIQGLPAEIRQAERWRIPLTISIHHRREYARDASELFLSTPTLRLLNLSSRLLTSLHGVNLRRLRCPDSSSAGSSQRARFCCTFSIPVEDLVRGG